MNWKNKLVNILKNKIISFLLGTDKPIPLMSKEQQLGLFSQMYENDSFRLYCNAREDYLIKEGMELFLASKIGKAERLAGQLLEVRSLRMRARASYMTIIKINKLKSER